MPYTLNGFGTKYYGKREKAGDGSYITTMWITALYIPVLPVGSYRVKPVGEGTNYVVHRSQSYQVARVPLCWEQIWHVYMIGAPILLLVGGFAWSEMKKDRANDAFHAQVHTMLNEIDAAQTEAERLESNCVQPLKGSDPKKDFESLHNNLRDRCVPLPPAIDAYVAKVGGMQKLIGEGLALNSLPEVERNQMRAYQTVWNVRRHQADETRQIAVCLGDLTHDCYAGIAPLDAAMANEDKQVCSLLATINQKCQ
jgi:hypothetical protein